MNSSGIKRGLATTAVAALAITGIPAVANAAPLAAQETTVNLRSVAATGGVISVAPDGSNSTFSLVATAPAGVEFVSFYYRPDTSAALPGAGDSVLIGTATASASGEYKLEWTPPVGIQDVDVLAVESNAVGAPASGATADVAEDATITGTLGSIEITDQETIGYFPQPGGAAYPTPANVAGISGTTSGTSVTVVAAGPDGSLGVAPGADAPVVGTPNAAGIRNWTATVNVAAGAIDADNDQILPVVATSSASRDAEGFNVTAQQIRNITATATSINPDTGLATVVVTVTDQNGNPVAGANVRNADGTDLDFTDARGRVTQADVSGAQTYYVNVDGTEAFTNGVDYRTTVTPEAARPAALTVDSEDGAAFDIDEYENGDIRVRVTDAAGNPLAGQRLFYRWTFTPFDSTNVAGTQSTREITAAGVTDADGYITVVLPEDNTEFTTTDAAARTALNEALGDTDEGGTFVLNAYVNRDGSNPGQDPVDLALEPATFKAGEAEAEWDGAGTIARPVGSTQAFSGSLELADGTALAGRTLNVTYTPTGNSGLSATQPAGTTRLSATSARVVSGANGEFSVSVTDPALPASDELGNTLTVAGTTTVGAGATAREGVGTDATDTATINFQVNAAPASITVVDGVALIDDVPTPGRPVSLALQVQNSAGDELAGQEVTLTLDNGFFTDGPEANGSTLQATLDAADVANGGADDDEYDVVLTADPAAANGAQYGEWVDRGQEITVTTDANGVAFVTVAIERNEGFDDDGEVLSTITATAGDATSGINELVIPWSTNTFNTGEPTLNPGSLEIVPGADEARDGDDVDLDIIATDQFGNRVKDDVRLSDNTSTAGFIDDNGDEVNGTLGAESLYTDEAGTYGAWSNGPVTQTITGTWDTQTNVYRDGNATAPGFQGVRTEGVTRITDSADIVWGDPTVTEDSVTLTSSPEGNVPVGTAVTETVTVVDEDGNPVAGVLVRFTHDGVGAPADAVERVTNAQGQAFYVVTSAEQGNAFITAVVEAGGAPITITDTVTFEGTRPGGRDPIAPVLKAQNNGKKADRLRLLTKNQDAAGAVVKIFRITKKGKRVLVAENTLNANGNFATTAKDVNGKKFSRYIARVQKTDLTRGGKSNVKRVR